MARRRRRRDRPFLNGQTPIHRVQAGRACLHTVDRQGQDPERLQTLQGSQTGTELRPAVGIAPPERLGDACRQSGAADTGMAVKDLLDPVDPLRREPLAEKRQRLEGLGVKGHRIVSRKQRGDIRESSNRVKLGRGKDRKKQKTKTSQSAGGQDIGENHPSTKVNAIGGGNGIVSRVMGFSVWVAGRIPPKARPLRLGGWIEAAVAQGGAADGRVCGRTVRRTAR